MTDDRWWPPWEIIGKQMPRTMLIKNPDWIKHLEGCTHPCSHIIELYAVPGDGEWQYGLNVTEETFGAQVGFMNLLEPGRTETATKVMIEIAPPPWGFAMYRILLPPQAARKLAAQITIIADAIDAYEADH